VVLVAFGAVYCRDLSWPGIVTTGIRHEQLLGVLNPEHIIIDQDLGRLPLPLSVHVDAKIMAVRVPKFS
jgi:hypothetical protein